MYAFVLCSFRVCLLSPILLLDFLFHFHACLTDILLNLDPIEDKTCNN